MTMNKVSSDSTIYSDLTPNNITWLNLNLRDLIY